MQQCKCIRIGIAVMLFTACFFSYMIRVNLSIIIIAMVKGQKSSNRIPECGKRHEYTPEKFGPYGNKYDWDSYVQGHLLAAYFYGYLFLCMPAGFLAERFGARGIMGYTTVGCAILTILTPFCAMAHWSVVFVNRFLIGFMAGLTYPCLHCLVSRWAPPVERSKFIASLLGGALGTVVTWPMSGAITAAWGWDFSCYIIGGLTLLWCILWFFFVSNFPDNHPCITDGEKQYILDAIGPSVDRKKKIPPYLKIFSSVRFWALVILHFGNLWGLYLLLTAGPKFMSEVLGFKLTNSGALAALPYLARLGSGFAFGSIADVIRKKNLLSVTAIRKIFVLFSHIIPGLLLFSIMLTKCNIAATVAVITLSLGFNGASTVTNLQNSQDLAPNYAGTLYGIINCIGGLTGIFTPMITAKFTEHKSTLAEWYWIFGIGASVYIFCGIVFIIFGTGTEQSWNQEETIIKKKKKDTDVPQTA